MDVAYDHVQEESYASPSSEPSHHPSTTSTDESCEASNSLNTDLQQAFQAVSSSPWGSRLGGWFSQARKQGESLVAELQKDAEEAQADAQQGWSSLREQVVQRTRGLSLGGEAGPAANVPGEEGVPGITKTTDKAEVKQEVDRPESLPADIVKEATTLVTSLRNTAAAKLSDLQKAEDAADEALLKFGTNIRNFLRDAVVITAPTDGNDSHTIGKSNGTNEVLFQTAEPATGRKVFHTSRLDAQLHAIHSTPSSFTVDPEGPQWEDWKQNFDVEAMTEEIARELEKYEELRRAMGNLVPENVEYRSFWERYWFLRKAVEEDERRRKEILKGAAASTTTDDLAWDDDDEEEDETHDTSSSTPIPSKADLATTTTTQGSSFSTKPSNDSTTTLHAAIMPVGNPDLLKPAEARRSTDHDDKSVAGSDTSYDIISGATTRALGSPKETRKDEEGSEEDDWE
ncbi:hypothetical protein LTR62_003513 [Meristemomyces frigidus]|uniref:BSD domain-containing protein n=1 Tax=Meristemomyces frigidus TaxID=1508187 RepID=A0AAN7TFJ1_9PEZI|nr:hypothetical protein LTR62_003513 [Meristemomyces frigidus]